MSPAGDAAVVLVGVVERRSEAASAWLLGEPLGAGERGGVGGRLELAVGAVPRPDVEDGGGQSRTARL